MISEKLLVCIIVMITSLNPGVEGQMACSCYEFVSDQKLSWQQAKESCNYHNKTLVVLETEEEWQFIENELKQRVSFSANEWLIGLFKNMTTGNWTWVNGKPLTINKWQPRKPGGENEIYTLISKEYPPGWLGSFNSITSILQRGWICEEHSVDCSGGVCWPRIQQPTTATKALPTNGISSTTATSRVVTSETEGEVPATTTRSNEQKVNEDKSPVEVIAAASVAGFLLILAIVLVTLYFVRRRKRLREEDAERPPSKSSPRPQKPESQYDSIDATEAATLLQTPTEDTTYAETSKKDRKKAPQMELEYAIVDKSGKKQPTGDLVYAELAEFDDGNDEAKPPKPAPYEPTVYADVDQPPLRTGSNPEEPTYANF